MGKCFQIHIIILNGHTDLTLSCHGSISDVSINISYLVIHFAFTNYGLPLLSMLNFKPGYEEKFPENSGPENRLSGPC